MADCPNCRSPYFLDAGLVDQLYQHDTKAPVTLRVHQHRCNGCGYSETEIPKLESLESVVAHALGRFRVDRDRLLFVYSKTDSAWHAIVLSEPRPIPPIPPKES